MRTIYTVKFKQVLNRKFKCLYGDFNKIKRTNTNLYGQFSTMMRKDGNFEAMPLRN